MKFDELMSILNIVAPFSLAMDFDNAGVIFKSGREDIKRVLVALDCSSKVADEAIEKKVDMVLTHHPLLFRAVKKLSVDNPEQTALMKLIAHDIGMVAMHTNLDIARGGVNDCLAKTLGLRDVEVIGEEDIARIGNLVNEMSLKEFVRLVNDRLNTCARFTTAYGRKDIDDIKIKRVAVLGGSGGEDYCFMSGADAYVTGEAKHSEAICAMDSGVNMIVAGHYETETVVLKPLIERLNQMTDDVEYILSLADESPLKFLSD